MSEYFSKSKVRRIVESTGVDRMQPEVIQYLQREGRRRAEEIVKEAEKKASYADRKTLMKKDCPCVDSTYQEITMTSITRLIREQSDFKSTTNFKEVLASIVEQHLLEIAKDSAGFMRADDRITLRIDDIRLVKGGDIDGKEERRD